MAELVTAPQPENHGDDDDFDGGLVDVTLTDGQYEIIPSLCRNWTLHAERPFSALIAIADAYLAPGADGLASLRQRARREDDEEMRRFKDQPRSAGRRASAPPRRQAVSVCSRRISVSSSGRRPWWRRPG